MIIVMGGGAAQRWPALAGLGGGLLVLLADAADGGGYASPAPAPVPAFATVLALCLLPWWPYLLVVGVALSLPGAGHPLAAAAFPMVAAGVLGGAQELVRGGVPGLPRRGAQSLPGRGAPGLGTAVAGLATTVALLGAAVTGEPVPAGPRDAPLWHGALLAAGLVGIAVALPRWRRADQDGWTWARLRPAVVAGAAVLLVATSQTISAERLGSWLGVDPGTFARYPLARLAIIGAAVLVLGTALAAVTGKWALAGALTAGAAQVGASTPLMLAFAALHHDEPIRWPAALAGALLGATLAASRWRVAAAVSLTLGAATALFIVYEAAGGHPEKMVQQHRVVPAMLLLVLVSAAVTAVAGATAPVLAPHGTVPAVLGPLAGVLALAGMFTTQVSFVRGRTPVDFTGNPVPHMVTAGYVLIAAAAAIGGLGVAQHMAERWAERKRAEQIRQEAAAAERERLARPIHDGVLQVLALVQREGADLGGNGARLAALAAEQEAALRNLLSSGGSLAGPASSGSPSRSASGGDLRATLLALSGPAVEVAAPATPVVLPATAVAEVTAAVQAALDNVRRHAGAGARAWLLLEDEGDGVRVTVRDDGAGFGSDRLAEAARAGRLGVAQSMRGRISDLGGTTTIDSAPGAGTEVEFWLPRRRSFGTP
ncbi:signal transduction histidine kinase [Actinoplanes octamycinicus]|uniref:Signal transduction histidine kinase n=1 Tax=Actinoplanes octamycinicus TaxID=135948 RepID=A0A7W7H0D6_9ACTN|nr:ATP-binding protein [Actinoplanes octamycinicus]MBB4741624.1 signal transduction histidine kinase [Actinoplanes octamycinicus]GIE57176.1 hypothetical protein Aoc01nite_25780 [Actinoplanes octamycinicus]